MLLKRLDAELLATMIISIFVYLISVTIGGYVQALYAKWLGDDTGEDLGFVSLNPMQHVDPIGLFLLVIFGFGWGSMVPIDTDKIYEPYRRFKILTLLFCRAFVHLVIATVALFTLAVFFKMFPSQALINKIFITGAVPLRDITDFGSSYASLMIVCALMLVTFVFYNIFLAMLSIVLNGMRFMLLVGVEEGYSYIEYADYIIFWGPFIFILFFSDPLRRILLWMIQYLVYALVGG